MAGMARKGKVAEIVWDDMRRHVRITEILMVVSFLKKPYCYVSEF